MRPIVSIIIVNFNTTDLLDDCLHSIFQYTPKTPFEVIVVDNDSSDRTALAALFARYRLCTLIQNTTNVGFAKAVNPALAKCQGDYALLLNPDAALFPHTLDAMVDFAKSNADVGVVGAKHLAPDNRVQLSWGRFPSVGAEIFRKMLHVSADRSTGRTAKYLDALSNDADVVDWVSGSGMLVTRSAWEKAGVLDESFFMYFEDIDWCRRIRDAGYTVRYLPTAPIRHIGGAAAARHKVDAQVAYRAGQFTFIDKYFGFATSTAVRAMVLFKSAFLLVGHLFRMLLAPASPAQRASKDNAMIQKKILAQTLMLRKSR